MRAAAIILTVTCVLDLGAQIVALVIGVNTALAVVSWTVLALVGLFAIFLWSEVADQASRRRG